MPKTLISIPQKGYTVSRAIVRGIAKDFITKTHLPPDTQIIFTEPQGGAKRDKNWATICQKHGIKTEYNNFLFVSFTDRYTVNGAMLNRYNKNISRHKPIYQDTDTGVMVTPFYAQKEYIIEFTVRLRDITRLRNWQSGIRMHDGFGPLVHQHHLYYDYSLPVMALHTLHTAALLKHGDDVDAYKQHFKDKFVTGVKTRSNSSGSHTDLIVVESQTCRYGEAEDGEFYNNLELQGGIWECRFSYKVTADEVLGVSVYVPAIINNQIIPQDLIDYMKPQINNREQEGYMPKGMLPPKALGTETGSFHMYFKGDGGHRLFDWDDWFPLAPPPNTKTISILPCLVDTNDPHLLFDINDLTEEMLPKEALDYVMKYKDKRMAYRKSLVGMEFYVISSKGEERYGTFIHNNRVKTHHVMNPMDRHYVRFYLHEELSTFDNRHMEEMMKDPDIFFPLLQLYDPTLEKDVGERIPDGINKKFTNSRTSANILHIPGNREVTSLSFTHWLRRYPHTSKVFKNMKYTFRPQVMIGRLGVK